MTQLLPDKYLIAEREAERFLRRIKELKVRIQTDERFREFMLITGGPETAAVKRSSLDLTRALARMRRP